MNFKNASAIEQITWDLRLADFPRSLNRAKINELFDGFPPYTGDEVQDNQIEVNTNFLDAARISHDARRQFTTAFLNPDPLFTVTLDYGPVYRRREWAERITRELNKVIKRNLSYLEVRRSTFASLVLHGIGPTVWPDKESWCPQAIGVEDALIPSGTLLTMENLPFFAVYQQYTGNQLRRMTSTPKVDPGWNLDLVNQAIKWVDEQASKLMASSWPEVWSPEKWEQREKEDSGLYSSDRVPTVDAFDFYFWNEDNARAGWERRIVLDAWGQPGVGGMTYSPNVAPTRGQRRFEFGQNEFLYDSSKRKNSKFADNREQIIHFQFADGSSVAPFRYHSVRSLGFLLFSICHLQNRLRCKFTEAVFENMLQYLRVNNAADAERAIKINLVNRGIIPDGVQFVRPEERWKVDQALIEACYEQNTETLQSNSTSYTQDPQTTKENPRQTATQTMAKVNASAALIGAMLHQAYNYQQFQYQEICRRFCIKNSKDADVRTARLQILKHAVPEEALNIEAWDVQPVRVIGNGNKMLQQQIAQQLLALVPQLDPSAQQKVRRLFIASISDDYQLADDLVPEQPHISDSVHDAQLTMGTLLQGVQVAVRDGVNHAEVIETLLHGLANKIAEAEKSGGMATPEQLQGFTNVMAHIAEHIKILAQNPAEKQRVKAYGDDLGQLANLVKAYGQRLQQAQEKQMQGNGNGAPGPDPKDAAKAQVMLMQGQLKNQLTAQSHAQRTAQRQLQFEQQMKQKAEQHQAELAQEGVKTGMELAHNRLKSLSEPTKKTGE